MYLSERITQYNASMAKFNLGVRSESDYVKSSRCLKALITLPRCLSLSLLSAFICRNIMLTMY